MYTALIYINSLLKKSILKEISWYTLGQIFIQIFAFLGVIVTSRYLGPTNIGLYSFVQNYLGVFMAITIGIDFYFTLKIAKSTDKIRELKEYIGHKFNITVVLSVIGIVMGWSILPRDVAQMATILFVPLFLSSCSGFYQYAVIEKKAKLIMVIQAISALISFLIKVALVFLSAPLIAFVVAGSIDIVFFVSVFALFYILQKEFRQKFRENKYTYPTFWKTGVFMYSIRMSLLAMMLWQLIIRIDQLVLATFTNAHALGIYAAAVKIAEVPNFFAGVLYTALITHVAMFADKHDSHSKQRIHQAMLIYFFSGLLIALGIIFCAPFIVKLLYGSKFIDSIPVLQAYAFSIPGMFLSFHFFGVYGVQDRHHHQALIFLFGLVTNVVLIYILTPLMGLVGAGIATSITYNLLAVAFYFNVR